MEELYGISSRDYLARARQCLDDGKSGTLFYAAFELRCGIEARMQEYLEVQEHISKKKRQGWQIAKLARNIEDAFRLGDKKAILKVRDKQTRELIFEFVYTPVTASLRKKAEQLGDILHSAKKFYPAEDVYWLRLRKKLKETYVELEVATSGTLLGPVLMHPSKRAMDMKVELPPNESPEKFHRLLNQQFLLEVQYE